MKYETEIPEGVNVVVSDKALSVTGPLGKLERNFAHIPLVSFTVKDNKVMIETPRARKQDKMFLNTSASHVRNLIEGVTKGYKYTLEIVHVHFPMRLAVQGKDIKAAQFNFIFYDVFDEYLYTFGGITLNYAYAYLKIYPRWKPSFYNDWMNYTVIVYLDKVRFGDDTIWRQDENRVAEEIVKTTRVLFKKEQLEKKRKEK